MYDTDTFVAKKRNQPTQCHKEDPCFSHHATLLVGTDEAEFPVDSAVGFEHHADTSLGVLAVGTYREHF